MSSLIDLCPSFPAGATVSVWSGPLEGPADFTHDDATPHYAASTVKVPLVLAVHRAAAAGELDLDEVVPVHSEFRSAADGPDGSAFAVDRGQDEDPEPWTRIDGSASLRWLCRRAIVRSSNLATNLLFERIGTERIAEALAACGTTGTRMTRGIEDALAEQRGLTNLVTAADLASVLRALAGGRALPPDATAEVLDFLADQEINEAIPTG